MQIVNSDLFLDPYPWYVSFCIKRSGFCILSYLFCYSLSCLRRSFTLPALQFSPKSKPSLKIGSVNKAGLFWYWSQFTLDLDHGFFRNKTFLFFKIESWNFQYLFEKEFRENLTKFQLNQTTNRKNENDNCLNKLNELKVCEVSRNTI